MGIGEILPSVHKYQGWIGQFNRMIRWYKKFKESDPSDFESPFIDESHDILFACFQNIFHLKDWLINDALLSRDMVNEYINDNIELQLCRDICNGSKHFNLTNASVDSDFTIIREYQPFHKQLNTTRNNIIILSVGHKFELKELAYNCISLYKLVKENKLIK